MPGKQWRVIRRDVFNRTVRIEVYHNAEEYPARREAHRRTVEQGGGGAFYEVEYS